jgi:mRNA-degrading endonuclease YafQ of YafQ-DinJ toxin-antitoxin module
MYCVPRISIIKYKKKFEKDMKALPPDILEAAKAAIADLGRKPIPNSRRLHSLSGYKNPKVFVIDVTSNHAWQITLEIDGETATLRRVNTHKEIDHSP